MNTLPRELYLARQVRELDRIAIDDYRIAGAELMARAGADAWQLLREHWPDAQRICVVCGGGNNGGDGYVVARHALQAGCEVKLIAAKPVAALQGDAREAARAFVDCGGTPCPPNGIAGADVDVFVDALVGTGLDRPVTAEFAGLIRVINDSGAPALAIDIPSGLNADTGAVLGCAVQAAATVTFIGLKRGLLTAAGRARCGALYFSALGVPAEVFATVTPDCIRIDTSLLARHLAARPADMHKGGCGHVLVVGGDYGYPGAVRLCGEAAARVGAGLVSIGTRPEHAVTLPVSRPELMARGIDGPGELSDLLERATVVAIGPGLGRSEWSGQMLARVLDSKLPLVIDADALHLLAAEPGQRDDWVLTPHPGEAASLLGCATADVQRDRFAAVTALAERFGGSIVLKGSGTLIAAGAERRLCSDGNPGMASGGMGDVLTGVIAGLIAQGNTPALAAELGVCLHAGAADRAAARSGERGLLAADLMPELRVLANPRQ